MSIQVVCPNGHVLRVKDCCAGQTGLCPTCKARVRVPVPANHGLTEDAIMGILGPHDPSRSQHASAPQPQHALHEAASAETDSPSPPKKSCTNCNREISAGTHICPHCHTYIAGLTDF